MDAELDQPIVYRMKIDGFAWHFNTGCDLYPEDNYEEKIVKIAEDYMKICTKCRIEIKKDIT